ncbi:LuxR C-terminal-related transcriptional regulator [Robiginitalea marina]|uniref:LuxR C-terminal-related transcriptional regulator n=1 Tax=Robiginitalea marina TaxID=2954105 RepID=UPI00273A5DA6|nr:LuxR C-terminal-related transcriptional regulator [Robiginitalea marina]
MNGSSEHRTKIQFVAKSKLYKPALRKEFVRRNALIERLEANISAPFTLVSASTGCGKSITVSQWIEAKGHNYGWLSLDEEHNDVQVFLTYIVALFKEQWPQRTFHLESLLGGSDLPSHLISALLINDLDESHEPYVLVLDDYHVIREEKIHEIIQGIIEFPPEKFHLVILTRRDPPFKMARLRAQHKLLEIRMADLAFTADEAKKLRSKIASQTTDEQIKALLQNTEGWITGITVGLMGLNEGIEFEKILASLTNSSSIISDLFDEVVYKGLAINTQKYLILTSLLDRFSLELIRAMVAAIDDSDLSQSGCREFIRVSRERNFFLIPLDSTGEWYRYHHLFKSQLNNRTGRYFSKEVVERLYKTASGWFEENQMLEEALINAIRSEDLQFAVAVFNRHRIELFNHDRIQRLNRFIALFPPQARSNCLEIVLSSAMLQNYNANFSDMAKHIHRAEELSKVLDLNKPYDRKLFGELHSLKDILSFKSGDMERTLFHAEKAMELIPGDEHYFQRESSVAYYSMALYVKGFNDRALEKLDSEFGKLASSDPFYKMRLLQGRCLIHFLEGNTDLMATDGEALKTFAAPEVFPAAWMMGAYSLAASLYMTNRLDNIGPFHEEVKKHRYKGWPLWIMHFYFIKCLSDMAAGRWDELDREIVHCEILANEFGQESIKGLVKAFQVELFLRKGDIDSAIAVSPFANFNVGSSFWGHYYKPELTQVKLLIQTRREGKGMELLQNLIHSAREFHHNNLLIQCLVLHAIVYAGESRYEEAKNPLEEALTLSKDLNHKRTFLDMGSAILPLLKEIGEARADNGQVLDLLHAIEEEKRYSLKKGSDKIIKPKKSISDLSKRELEILSLVSRGANNGDIAEELFISLDTVKKHLYRAYQKLYVSNRMAAVRRAQELDLLPGE